VPAGTVVDNPQLTSPHLFDWFMVSHAPLKGTSRCVRYIVLVDEVGCGADALQLLSYWLCYLFCRCTR
jgi:eukaryotic translation initiation factor 2C